MEKIAILSTKNVIFEVTNFNFRPIISHNRPKMSSKDRLSPKAVSSTHLTLPTNKESEQSRDAEKDTKQEAKKGRGKFQSKNERVKKEGRTIGAALMKQKRRKYCCLKKK